MMNELLCYIHFLLSEYICVVDGYTIGMLIFYYFAGPSLINL